LGNSEQPREKAEPSKRFLFFWQAGGAIRSSFVFPFLSEGLFWLSKAWQGWVRKYEKIPEGNEVGLFESVLISLAARCMRSVSQQAF